MIVRLRYAKRGKVRFVSHRDVARAWERALRRIDLAVAYTAGFSPRPKLAFGLALSTGHESVAEYLDITLADAADGADPSALVGELTAALPTGIDVVAATVVAPSAPSLQGDVQSCSWRIEAVDIDVAEASVLVAQARAADHLVLTRQRKGRDVTDDLRPAVLGLSCVGPTDRGVELDAELAVHPRSVRPAELLAVLRPEPVEEGLVLRTAQWIWRDGSRTEPLPAETSLDATLRPRTLERAS